MKVLHNSKGFTLVELMIVISIVGALLLVGSSLTSSWVDGSKVNDATSALKNAVSQARVNALRNSNNKLLSEPTVSVCIEDGSIKIISVGTNATLVCESVTSSLIQDISIPKSISITQNGSDVKCITFNPAGLVLSFPGCTNNTNDKIIIERNGENSEFNII